jgi:hypothetical protein
MEKGHFLEFLEGNMDAILEFSLGVYVVLGIIFFLFLKLIFNFSSKMSFCLSAVLAVLLIEFPWISLVLGLICFFIVKKKSSKYITAGLTILLLATGSLLSHEIDKTAEQESQEVVHSSVRNTGSLEEEKNEGQTNNEEEPQAQVEVPADVPDENTQSVQIEEVKATEIVEEETSEDTSEVIENTVTEESSYYYEEVVYDDGSAYKGNFVNGLYHGYGMLTWADGNKYDGDFANSYFHGEGTLTWSDGSIYKGQFRNNLQNGYGEMTWPDGTMFKGNFVDGNYIEDGEWIYPE